MDKKSQEVVNRVLEHLNECDCCPDFDPDATFTPLEHRIMVLSGIIENVFKVMDHSFGDGWRKEDFLSVDYGANDSVDGMQDMAKILRGVADEVE